MTIICTICDEDVSVAASVTDTGNAYSVRLHDVDTGKWVDVLGASIYPKSQENALDRAMNMASSVDALSK